MDVDSSDGRSRSRKYCSHACLNSARRTRHAAKPKSVRQHLTLGERLWSRIIKMPNGCWEWQGYRMPKGYGQIGLDLGAGKTMTTHRAAWMLTHGEIPPDLFVCHKCDNPPCVNPDHLFLGTIHDNNADRDAKGRTKRGFELDRTVLSEEDVRMVRREYRRFRVPGVRGYRSNSKELAAQLGVSRKYIAAIAAGKERSDV